MTAYLGTPEKLTTSQLYHARKFLRKHKNDRLIAFENYVIDVISLAAHFNLDCKNCHRAHHLSCCEQGRPYTPQKKVLQQLELHAEQIVMKHLSLKQQNQFKLSGYTERSEETDYYNNITLCGDNCFFFAKGEESYCSIHKYALEKELELKSLKPMSCMMYPIDIIEIDGRVLITAIHRDTLSFSRWDDDYFRLFLCANPDLRNPSEITSASNIKDNIPTHAFLQEEYRPAYEWGKDLIIDLCGKETYEKIESLIRR